MEVLPRSKTMKRSRCYYLVALSLFLGGTCSLSAQDIKSELRDLNAMRKGVNTDLATVDRRGLELIAKYSEPKNQGQIYYELAIIHSQSGMRQPEQVVKYAQKALTYPLEPSQTERLYVFWGDALRLTNSSKPFPERRKEAVIPYLKGLKELLQYNLPDVAPDLPAVSSFEASPESGSIYQALKHEHEQEWAAHNEAVFQRDMIKHHDVLIGQIAGLYGRKPYAKDEVERLARDSLGNSALVNKLLEAVDVKMKADAARTPPGPVPIPSSPPKPTWGEARWLWTLGSFVVLIAAGVVSVFFLMRKRNREVDK